jgi:GDP-L-fucose synthase
LEQGIKRSSEGHVTLTLWGTGTPMREFLHVTDMADACVYVMENVDFEDLKPRNSTEVRNTHINIGSGKELTIRQLAELVKKVTGFSGELHFDSSKPDGTMRKLLDISKLEQLGWKSKIELADGVKKVFEGYLG